MAPSETVAEAVRAAAADIRKLDPGALADLRRATEGRIAPAFWRLVSRHPQTIGRPRQEHTWKAILRIIAILTPTGNPDRPSLHDHSQRLGKVLCDGGNPNWGKEDKRPALSESRMAQLLSSRGNQRAVLLTRAARAIARSRSPNCGINVVDLAYALLRPDDMTSIAKPYYDRLDAAQRAEPTGETPR